MEWDTAAGQAILEAAGGRVETLAGTRLHYGKPGLKNDELFETIFERVHPLFAASIEAAMAAGDLKPGPIASANRFWFGHHVAAMVAFVFLPGRASVPYQGAATTLVEEASWFILRGIGMRDAAIAAAIISCTQNPLELAPA